MRNTDATLEDHHPVGAHSLEDKNEFAEAITQVYKAVPIPRFYVVVIFEEVAADSFFVGGAAHGTFVRIQIEDNVKALVYLSAYALEEGESLGALQGRFPDPPLAAALVYTTFPIDGRTILAPMPACTSPSSRASSPATSSGSATSGPARTPSRSTPPTWSCSPTSMK